MSAALLWIALIAQAADATASAPPPAPAAGGPDLLEVLPEGEGRVLSEKPGGTVEAKAGRNTVRLRDGEAVKFIDDNSGIGMGEDTMAEVIARKKKVMIPNGQVILEDRLHRSPDDRWAVFSAFTSCGDFCYADGWLLGPQLRLRLTGDDFGPDVVVAWRPDGKEVAVGSRGLWLVSLPDAKAVRWDDFTAPTYGPDGRLFVRGHGKSDAVYVWVPGGKPRKILAARGAPPQSEPGTDTGDPAPVTFAADGAPTATFERGFDMRVRTTSAAEMGKNPDGTPAPRPPRVEKALALILDPASAPSAAASSAWAEGERTPAFAHELAVAANTRGYRLYQEGKLDDALPLFISAAGLDVKYGMPRYNLARVYALKGNAKESAVYLRMLKIMGKPQRARLEQAAKDDAFKKVAGSPEVRAIFE